MLAEEYLGHRDGVERVSADELADRLARGQVVVLDVRPEVEYRAGHIPCAVSAPIETLPAGLPSRRSRPRGAVALVVRGRVRVSTGRSDLVAVTATQEE